MRFNRLDLNLLVALDALLTEKSVSVAAERICLSQPAMSGALSRLRECLNDDLLVSKGRSMVLTARAQSLIEPVKRVLHDIRQNIFIPPEFEPGSSNRVFRLMASDYVSEVMLADCLRAIKLKAPGVHFEVYPIADDAVTMLERNECDALINIGYGISSDHPTADLFEDDYVVVGWKENPALAEPISVETYLSLGHVATRFNRGRIPAYEDSFMLRKTCQRRVEVVVPNFLAQFGHVIGSDLVATVHRRLAMRMARQLPLVVRELPFEIPAIREVVQWHSSNRNDSAIRWLVDQLVQGGAAMDHAPTSWGRTRPSPRVRTEPYPHDTRLVA